VPGFIGARFTNLSDGVDTNFFHPGKAVSPESRVKHPLILLPSRITEGKGHLDAIKALLLLLNESVSATLAFAGVVQSPALMDNLQRIISEVGLQERVIFAGALSPEELRNWYAASSLVLLPSYAEGLGKVLLEAQAMERPVVAYDVGGVPDALRHPETGYLVKKGDIEGLVSRLRQLIEEPGIRREMGERGRKFVVERFSMESLTARHEQFYAGALKLNK
jgi:phosphatidyl-myo-inositol dimannoside synthase